MDPFGHRDSIGLTSLSSSEEGEDGGEEGPEAHWDLLVLFCNNKHYSSTALQTNVLNNRQDPLVFVDLVTSKLDKLPTECQKLTSLPVLLVSQNQTTGFLLTNYMTKTVVIKCN